MISDLLVTRLGTCMLVRSLVLENRRVSLPARSTIYSTFLAHSVRG